jgi:hypothetical protein
MAGNCVDRNLCSTGCGFPDSSTMATLRWYVRQPVTAKSLPGN